MTQFNAQTASAIVAVSLSFLVVSGDVAVRYFGSEARAIITAGDVVNLGGQVADLKNAVKDLSDKIRDMPRPGDLAAISGRMDRQDAILADIRQTAATLRADVDNIMHPPVFRNPK